MTEFKVYNDTGYGLVPRSVMRNPELSFQAKAIYSYLASFAGNTGRAFPSTSLMSKELDMSRDTLFKYLKELKEKKVITVERERTDKGTFDRNIYYLHNEVKKAPSPNLPDTVKPDMDKPDTVNYDTNSNNLNSNNLNSNNKDIYSSAKAKQEIPYKEIMDYLNEKTGKKYKHTASGNKKLIKARWNEGYTLEDFKKVIDVKVEQWSKDKKMQQYLRPNTLFSNKFDNYLNEEVAGNERISTNSTKNEEELEGKCIGSWF